MVYIIWSRSLGWLGDAADDDADSCGGGAWGRRGVVAAQVAAA